MNQQQWPVVGIPCDVFKHEAHPFHGSGEKYINAVAHGVRAIPLLLPAVSRGEELESLTERYSPDDFLDSIHGLFLTGNTSDVDAHYYHEISRPGTEQDPQRDATTLPLIRRAIARNIPILAICRGCQELNVALGGSLHQHLCDVPGLMDHQRNQSLAAETRYGFAHDVMLTSGGLLRQLSDTDTVGVNSLHGQGIKQLAAGLEVEATAADGLIEAVRLADHSRFVVGVQWHPEWQFQSHHFYRELFRAFGDAIRARL